MLDGQKELKEGGRNYKGGVATLMKTFAVALSGLATLTACGTCSSNALWEEYLIFVW